MNKFLTKLWTLNKIQKVLGIDDINRKILKHMIQSGDFVKFGYIFILTGIYFFGENIRKLELGHIFSLKNHFSAYSNSTRT